MSPALGLLAVLSPFLHAAEFPIGLYNVHTASGLHAAAAAGFTHVLGGDDSTILTAAVSGLEIVGIPRPAADLLRPSTAPPVSAWYISDEPEVNRQSTSTIARIASDVRRWSPGTPLTLVIGAGRYAAAYAPYVDIIMVDWYPVPHLPLSSAAEQVSIAAAGAGGKPVWAVLQAMDWRDYPQRDPNKPRIGRFPTFEEIRFMSYHAILRGASGIFYFEFLRRSVPGETLLDYPERWKALTKVVGELRVLKPFFEASPGEAFNFPGLEGRTWHLNGEKVAVLINPNPRDAVLPQSLLDGAWKGKFEGPDDLKDAFPEGRLPPFGVAVLISR